MVYGKVYRQKLQQRGVMAIAANACAQIPSPKIPGPILSSPPPPPPPPVYFIGPGDEATLCTK